MVKNIEDIQQFGKDNMDATMKSFGSLSKSMQAIAVEVADYSKKVFEDGDMTVQVVGGPNERCDYHDDPVEEFFYQLKGDMVLKIVENGTFYEVPIREGEVFLLPRHVPHSPQRPQEGSIGLVVEAARPDEAAPPRRRGPGRPPA